MAILNKVVRNSSLKSKYLAKDTNEIRRKDLGQWCSGQQAASAMGDV